MNMYKINIYICTYRHVVKEARKRMNYKEKKVDRKIYTCMCTIKGRETVNFNVKTLTRR